MHSSHDVIRISVDGGGRGGGGEGEGGGGDGGARGGKLMVTAATVRSLALTPRLEARAFVRASVESVEPTAAFASSVDPVCVNVTVAVVAVTMDVVPVTDAPVALVSADVSVFDKSDGTFESRAVSLETM